MNFLRLLGYSIPDFFTPAFSIKLSLTVLKVQLLNTEIRDYELARHIAPLRTWTTAIMEQNNLQLKNTGKHELLGLRVALLGFESANEKRLIRVFLIERDNGTGSD